MIPGARPFEPLNYLTSPEAIAAFLADALESGDGGEIADAMAVVGGAPVLTDALRALCVTQPNLTGLLAVVHGLGFRLAPTPAQEAAA